jgi:hypothetical protein
VYNVVRGKYQNMKVYQQEVIDGLSDTIKANATIAYCSPAIICEPTSTCLNYGEKLQASSGNPKQMDLYYLKSVLVSTGWNKNDDVFPVDQTWSARHTPEDKQFNFMHNENDIIGHITGSYVVDRNGSLLNDNIENIPDEFDIITEAVIYNSWTNPENRERMNTIIQEIEEGKWFVSMECLFAGFDYAVSMNGNNKIIARNEESAFLTKHLRAYGGTGEYEGYKIGRSLRDISFSGKGLVSRPANPRSVILDASKAFSVRETSLISDVTLGEKNMSDTYTKDLEKQLADVRSELASAKEENVLIKKQIEASKDKEYASTVSEFENLVTAQKETILSLEEQVASLNQTLSDIKASLEKKEEEVTSLSVALEAMNKKDRNRGRKEMLVEAGFDATEAEESLDLYDSLNDQAFESIVAVYKKKMAKYMDKKKEEEMKNKAEESAVATENETEVTPELLEGLQTSEATLIDSSDDHDELASTRASVAEWIANNVLNK